MVLHSRHPYPRHVRVAAQLQREIAQWLMLHAEPPLNTDVTITRVEVAKDLSHADVFFLGHEHESADELELLLDQIRPEIQRVLGAELRMKRVPRLQFRWDRQYEHAAQVERILFELNQTDNS
ncbi:MAG: 30S ribosome-binding factor RbfA [Candidatus Dadabacteria bacterium]|nr:MAG: 30S ribosome-binding factor RbfA [Candidatus Dadabacteria bacterium]